jgi:hypothetical protein
MKHKHAEVIHAWADGAKVQCRIFVVGGEKGSGADEYYAWYDIESPPWNEDEEYRVKPKEPVIRWQWAYGYTGAVFHQKICAGVTPKHYTKEEYERAITQNDGSWYSKVRLESQDDNHWYSKIKETRQEFDE